MKVLSGLVLCVVSLSSLTYGQNAEPKPVNVHNFVRAETDLYFRKAAVGHSGSFGTGARWHRSTGRTSCV
jgi:hypothetical protein